MTEEKKYIVADIGFWSTAKGSLCSGVNGLTTLEIEYLKSLRPGDRLILYPEVSNNPKSPQVRLKRFWRDGETLPNGTIYHERSYTKPGSTKMVVASTTETDTI